MKASALSLLFSLLIVQFNAQSFSSPESVEYDGVNNEHYNALRNNDYQRTARH